MSTLALRKQLIEIHRQNVGKVEVSRNVAPWIAPLWAATSYKNGMANREPYCAAGMAWGLREWLKLPAVLAALKMTPQQAEQWRCKSALAFGWGHWARDKKLPFIPKFGNFHTGDIIVYSFSHIEIYVDDDIDGGPKFTAIGYNTNGAGSRDGDGCWEKTRSRANIKEVFRLLP